MLAFDQCPREQLAGVQGVFTDVDDTLTEHGRLSAATYQTLEDLHAAGIRIVPVTGGPASWADHIARVWPVTAAIGESGAVTYARTPSGFQTLFAQSEPVRSANAVAREQAWAAVAAKFPAARLAQDQCFRLCDLAIDHGQDAKLSPAAVDGITATLMSRGFTVRVSSIHINAWRGPYDKPEAAQRIATDLLKIDLHEQISRWLYVGDSLNDEGMFELFPLSVGVANISRVADQLTHKPRYITRAAHGAGFVEVARAVLRARG
jgi:HAD superfamily hydrolase (TIGR01484 family)